MAVAAEGDAASRSNYVAGFVTAMASADKPIEGYDAVPAAHAGEAFRALAEKLLDEDEEGSAPSPQLPKLIEAHRKREPKDVYLDYFAGVMHHRKKEYDLAESAFAACMTKPLDPEEREMFRAERVIARFHAGKGMSAYKDVGPADATFTQLARLYGYSSDAKNLAELVAEHRKASPDHPGVHYWQAEVDWLNKDYAKAAEAFARGRDRWKDTPEFAHRGPDRLVRSLIRLKRADEAWRELARDPAVPANDPLLEAAVRAANGDVIGAGKAMDKWVGMGRPSAAFYSDEDLGPLLRTEAFGQLREQFPPPAAKKDGAKPEV
jgi:hypothetical protein